MSFRKPAVLLFALLLGATLVLPAAANANGPATPGISPEAVDLVLFPGQSFDLDKTVTTPEIPPGVEVCLLQDETGSFIDDIGNLQGGTTASDIYDAVVAAAPGAKFAVAGFRDYPTSPYGSPGDWVYRLLGGMSDVEADWLAGIAGLSASGGNDTPEAQYDAIVAALIGGFGQDPCGFSTADDVTRVLVVTTDAPFHLPGDGKPHVNTEASTITALTTTDVIVVGLKAPGAGGELDSLASATGGSVQELSSDGSNIAAAILAGLSDVDIDVEMTSDCAAPVNTSFDPAAYVDVPSGSILSFNESISVDEFAPPGTYECKDWALIDGSPMTDASGATIYEYKTIEVPANFVTGGGNIVEGKGKNRINLLTFGGNAGFLLDGTLVGHWTFNFHEFGVRFITTELTGLQFYDSGGDPAPPGADADTAMLTAIAKGDLGDGWIDGCTVEVSFRDGGEPEDDLLFGIGMTCPGGIVVGLGELSGGNIQIHNGYKG